jgi:hypothetical protein
MFIQFRPSDGELGNQAVTVFVDQRRLFHVGWIARSQVHRTIAAAGAALHDNTVQLRTERDFVSCGRACPELSSCTDRKSRRLGNQKSGPRATS